MRVATTYPDDAQRGDQTAVLTPLKALPNLTDRVYDVLKQYIVDQRLKPGSKLSVPRLAEQLRVSRTPVKESLERLARDGLVTILSNRGAYVAILHRADVNEIYQMREVLEGLAAGLAAPNVDTKLLLELRRLLSEGEAAVGKGDIWTHANIDLTFHRLIRERAENRRLLRALESLQNQIRVVLRTSATIPGRMEKALAEHRRILSALEARDPTQAEDAARDHVRKIREAVLVHIQTVEGPQVVAKPASEQVT